MVPSSRKNPGSVPVADEVWEGEMPPCSVKMLKEKITAKDVFHRDFNDSREISKDRDTGNLHVTCIRQSWKQGI